MDAQGEVVVITGGSAGIGRATAREFARRGCRIALLARGHERLEATAREVEALGGRAVAIPTDVADLDQVREAADQAERALGPIDIWINNAFAGIFSRFMDMTPEEYRRVTDVTYLGQVHGTRAALERMRVRDRGTIVLIGSALAYRGIPLQSAYCAAKHAVQGFQDSLRCELMAARSGINLVMVQLPGVNTPQFDWVRAHVRRRPRPVGAVYQPEVAARAIWLAAHSRRKQIIVGAPAWQAILGDKLASGLLDRYLARTNIEAQQDEEPVAANRADNLFEPVAGDPGAHGRFGAEARQRSLLLWATRHPALTMLGVAGAGLAAVAALRGRSGASSAHQ